MKMRNPTAIAGTSVVEHEGRRYPLTNGVADVPPHVAEGLRKKGWKEVKEETATGAGNDKALADANAKITELQGANDQANAKIEELTTELADANAKITELQAKIPAPEGGDQADAPAEQK